MLDSEKITNALKDLGIALIGDVEINKFGKESNGQDVISGVVLIGSPKDNTKRYFASCVWEANMQDTVIFEQWCKEIASELAIRNRQYLNKKQEV